MQTKLTTMHASMPDCHVMNNERLQWSLIHTYNTNWYRHNSSKILVLFAATFPRGCNTIWNADSIYIRWPTGFIIFVNFIYFLFCKSDTRYPFQRTLRFYAWMKNACFYSILCILWRCPEMDKCEYTFSIPHMYISEKIDLLESTREPLWCRKMNTFTARTGYNTE